MKIALVLGTRPEAIKLAPVILALRRDPAVGCRVWVTGQHRSMLDQVLDAFDIRPDVDLEVMTPGQSLAELTSRCLTAVDRTLVGERPDLVVVQGDTTTAFAASLAAFYARVPVAHVEAGLRTGNLDAPWPEEANRVLTARLAALHFAPTEIARANLVREGVASEAIAVTGNTVVDALFLALDRLRRCPAAIAALPDALRSGESRVVLITGHRRESFGGAFEQICLAIADLARRFPDVRFVYPVHLNPRVREPVQRILARARLANVHLIEPLPYLPFVWLMNQAALILTDSGGIQEEAPSLGTPVLVMREATERPEGLRAGCVRLVGHDRNAIVAESSRLLDDPHALAAMSRASDLYGDGRAAARIVERCTAFVRTRDVVIPVPSERAAAHV